ncbi:hypothetical protein J2X20_000893 [Pelomonas saccharophila]|uniref:Ice-binding protein C-terminal domain-containing protein n=1 Tax=Roseateles saccharophilus TaxID=304 RepID=A0ABU1YHC7_ROSSA|nr:PEP-CTERM sorting domain-containing protein [Roseateles saccharophilus]MDR7268264.1 hypothetical protein [Roseateles saccharophilus]
MKLTSIAAAILAASLCSGANAGIVFTFTENGANVVMNSSGTIDTSLLVLQQSVSGWGGTGVEQNGNHDIMGGTSVGAVNMSFGFHAGTNFSAWSSANGPWAQSSFNTTVNSGHKGFTTYIRANGGGPQLPGLGIEREDLEGTLWSPDQTWTFLNSSFASLQMFAGTYTVTDAQTGEFITFQIGAANHVPEPDAAALVGLALVGAYAARRAKARKTA